MPKRKSRSSAAPVEGRNGPDEQRLAELVDDQRRLVYVRDNYLACMSTIENPNAFNESLERLKAALGSVDTAGEASHRLHPYLELLISYKARRQTAAVSDRDAELTAENVSSAVKDVVETIRPIRGRPSALILRYHVEGLMALIEEMSGNPVRSVRYKDRHYDPQISTEGGKVIEIFFAAVDPSVTRTALANIVRDVRRMMRGKPMRFRDYFPFFDGDFDIDDVMPVPGPGYRCEHFELVAPIYCP